MLTEGLPLRAALLTVVGWVSREQQRTIEYLIEEKRVLKEQMGGRRLRLTNDQRRRLAEKGKQLGLRLLGRVATIVTPDTIMRWHRQLIAAKWTSRSRAGSRSGVMREIRALSNIDDGTTGVAIIEDVGDPVRPVIADAAYDTRPVHDAAEARGAEVVVPPSSKASASGRRRRSKPRDQAIRRVKELGRRRWKKESGYHRQARVENTFYRYKTVIGGRLRARALHAQEAEAVLACNALNRMRELGWPKSEKVPG